LVGIALMGAAGKLTAVALHRLVLSEGQTPVRPGSIQWGNVTPYQMITKKARTSCSFSIFTGGNCSAHKTARRQH